MCMIFSKKNRTERKMALMKQLLLSGSGVRFRLNLSTVNEKYMKIKTPKKATIPIRTRTTIKRIIT